VIARVSGGRVLLDARTLTDDEIEPAARGLAQALAAAQEIQAPGPGAQPREEQREGSHGEAPDDEA
jgi:hypothetical protein